MQTEGYKKIKSSYCKNKKRSLETRRRMAEAQNRPDVKRRKSISGKIAQNLSEVKKRKSKAFKEKKLINRHKIDCNCSFCKRRREEQEQEETRKNRSEALMGKTSPNKGKRFSNETKSKMRKSAIEYIKKTHGDIHPRVGKNEKTILDKLEKKIGYKIDRKFTIDGYFPDGYIHELNLIIEVDERPKTKQKDIEREQIIRKVLDCNFLRIKDY